VRKKQNVEKKIKKSGVSLKRVRRQSSQLGQLQGPVRRYGLDGWNSGTPNCHSRKLHFLGQLLLKLCLGAAHGRRRTFPFSLHIELDIELATTLT
jgi:hypothetical protein